MPRCPQCGNNNEQNATFCNYCGTHLKGAEDPLVDRIVGKFRLKERIGGGGFGSVYRAEHIELGNLAAIKVLHPHLSHNSLMVERFYREAKLLAKLDHPNIVKIIDYGKLEGLGLYLIMEWLDGNTIQWHLKNEGPPPLDFIKKIFEQLLDALAYAHSLGVVHRDLKPENLIWICKGKRTRLLKILDFGIARILQDSGGVHLTETGLAVGTPRYMSPEQAAGELDKVDHRSDIYACGVLLLELLTGKPIFTGTTNEILIKQIEAPPPRLSDLAPDKRFPPGLELVLQRALHKNPAHRYDSAEEFAEDLIGILECEETQIISPSSVYNPPPIGLRDNYAASSSALYPSHPVITGQREQLVRGETTPSPAYSPRAPYDYQPSSPGYSPSQVGGRNRLPQNETKALPPSLAGQLILNGKVAPPSGAPEQLSSSPSFIAPEHPNNKANSFDSKPQVKVGKKGLSSSLLGVFVGLGGAISLVVLIFFLFFFSKSDRGKDELLEDLAPIELDSPKLPPIGTGLQKDKTISIDEDEPITPVAKGKRKELKERKGGTKVGSEQAISPKGGTERDRRRENRENSVGKRGPKILGTRGTQVEDKSKGDRSGQISPKRKRQLQRIRKTRRYKKRYKRRRTYKKVSVSYQKPVKRSVKIPSVKKVSIMIKTTPSGATVWVDDIKMGKSPLMLVFPSNKKIKIWVKKPGYMGKKLIWEVWRGSPKPIVLPEDIVSGE